MLFPLHHFLSNIWRKDRILPKKQKGEFGGFRGGVKRSSHKNNPEMRQLPEGARGWSRVTMDAEGTTHLMPAGAAGT